MHIGTVIRVPFDAPSQAAAYNNPLGVRSNPHGPTVAFHVVGFEATENEFPSGGTPFYAPLRHPSVRPHGDPARRRCEYQYLVRLRQGR